MPQCQQCGAELRPGARFCNRCGAVQQPTPAAAQPIGPSTGQPVSAPPIPDSYATQVPAPDAVDQSSVDEAARAKRPPRIQRTREEDEPETATGAPITARQPVASAGPVVGSQAPQSGDLASAAAEHEMPSLAAAESDGASPSLTSPSSQAPMPSATIAPDGLPWPLPAGAFVAERYRIEALLSAGPTPADENVYRVSDQRGFERCWSCGTTHEPAPDQPPEQYCPQCGADMLARPYLLRERLLPAEQAATASIEIPPDVLREGMRLYSVAPQEAERSAFPLGAHIVIASASDIGRERAAGQNEDSVAQFVVQIEHASRAEPLALGMVADGLGGHSSGSEASQVVARTVLAHVLRELLPLLLAPTTAAESAPPSDDTFKQALRESITAANAELHAANAASQRDMGSTIVAALIWGETAYIANVGDSRAYVLNVHDGSELRRLTADHSLVEQLVAGGMIPPEERYTHPSRNQIYRSLGVGSGDELTVDLYTQRLHPGMRLLLCSDGLWEMVRDDELAHILRETPHPQGACDALVAAANTHGGEDNISALVIDVTG